MLKPDLITREELYEAMWTESAQNLAKALGISDVGLAKICKKLNVPKPPRGYWAKPNAARKLLKKSLPPVQPDQEETYRISQWATQGGPAWSREALKHLADEGVQMPSVSQASAQEGDHTPDRPHRMARLLSAPATVQTVPLALMEALAAPPVADNVKPPAPKPAASSTEKSSAQHFDVAAYLKRMGKDQDVEGPEPWEGGYRWTFKVCPWRESDGGNAATILQLSSGAISAGCLHDTCPGSRSGKQNHWHDLRALWGDAKPDDYSKVIARLAALHPLEYEAVRVEEAKQLKCRATELDKLVYAARPHGTGTGTSKGPLCSDIEAWPDPVNPAALLDELLTTIKRFIVCNEETAIAAVLSHIVS